MDIIMYRAYSFREPVRVRESLCETIPCHADMMRYDGAFHHPVDPSYVVFPVWKTPDGVTPRTITTARWDSFIIKLTPVSASSAMDLESWITYEHGNRHELVPLTFAEFKAKYPRYKLHGWR